MTTAVILATGPSMSADLAQSVQGKAEVVIAVSDAYRIAPWATALVSQDRAWWKEHGEAAASFAGRKFSGPRGAGLPGVETIEPGGLIATGTNSGLLAGHVAVKVFGVNRVLFLGLDMAGAHFFGLHPAPLKNTTPARYEVMKDQFAQWRPRGVEILNCTPGSLLRCYPFKDLCDALG